VRQVIDLSEQLGVSGFPVCDGGKVVGIVTGRDLRFETRYDIPVSHIMTPREKLVTVPDGTTLLEAKALLNKHKLERLLVVNAAFELKGLITVKDITKQTSFPNAARDARRASCVSAPRWAWARAPKSASRRWCVPVSMRSWSTRPMATARA
jgi:IMP dehydrogenase